MTQRIPLLTLVILPVLFSCQARKAWTRGDAWYNPPPETGMLEHGRKLAEVHVVPDQKLNAALARLEDAPVVKIGDNEASSLTGSDIGAALDGRSWYLVRALRLGDRGHFTVYEGKSYAWVRHGSLDRSATAMQRAALLVALGEEPEALYISVNRAE